MSNVYQLETFTADRLKVVVSPNRLVMGHVAAEMLAEKIKAVARRKKEVNMMFASAPSQAEVLDFLVARKDIPWEKMNCFHMDEYVGLTEGHPQSFRRYLLDKVFSKARPKALYLIKGESEDVEVECQRYAMLLKKHPLDILQGGIGLLPHIAFNDPENADFKDPYVFKIVKLQKKSRIQQVKDKCFPSLDQVPLYAFTVTMPPMIKAGYMSLTVPSTLKAKAVHLTVHHKIETSVPSSIIRQHPDAAMFLDTDSAALL
ncbi:MAG: hypothetical protein A2297_04440 [Elusimicrobia bacterium RIFOXYB2_FULL_48_7]|nr:MAG: hypothetical protein A2297_04440 [Elusimicrobia bacterium RIFOXYB2_FULL_48_7]